MFNVICLFVCFFKYDKCGPDMLLWANLDLILNVCSQRQKTRLNVPKMRIPLMSYHCLLLTNINIMLVNNH